MPLFFFCFLFLKANARCPPPTDREIENERGPSRDSNVRSQGAAGRRSQNSRWTEHAPFSLSLSGKGRLHATKNWVGDLKHVEQGADVPVVTNRHGQVHEGFLATNSL